MVVGTMLTEYEITSYGFTSRLSLTLWVAMMPPPPPPSPRINVGVSWWSSRTVCNWYSNIDSGEGGNWYCPNTFDHDCRSNIVCIRRHRDQFPVCYFHQNKSHEASYTCCISVQYGVSWGGENRICLLWLGSKNHHPLAHPDIATALKTKVVQVIRALNYSVPVPAES